MPEGHTIHRAARDQRRMLAGQTVHVSSPQGRFMEGAAMIDGETCESVEAYGKHLLYGFGNGLSCTFISACSESSKLKSGPRKNPLAQCASAWKARPMWWTSTAPTPANC